MISRPGILAVHNLVDINCKILPGAQWFSASDRQDSGLICIKCRVYGSALLRNWGPCALAVVIRRDTPLPADVSVVV